jgi:hypothetical protein
MRIIQEFLKVVLCGFIVLTVILTLALAEEVAINDKDRRVQVGKNHEMSRQAAKVAKVKQIPYKDFLKP